MEVVRGEGDDWAAAETITVGLDVMQDISENFNLFSFIFELWGMLGREEEEEAGGGGA